MAIVLYVLTAISLAWLLAFLLGRRLSKVWLILLGVSPVVLIYVLNPEFRVYSFHSFMHAGIVYQILNGNIPPPDPLLAGHVTAYPWGAHLVAAGISRLGNVTPFLAIAIMNVGSLVLVMILIYKISQFLIDDEKTNILSVVISIYGITFMNPSFMKLLGAGIPTEFRGVPILLKFITINVLPLGLVAFLLFVYSVLRLEKTGRAIPNVPILLVSILGVGYVYPAFLPGVGVSLALAWIASLVCFKREAVRWNLSTLAFTTATLIVAVLAVRPYLASMTAGTVNQMQVFSGRMVAANLKKYAVVAVPILVVLLANYRAFRRVDPKALLFLVIVVVSTAGAYLAIHLNMDNEYKFLLLSTVTLGILGGVAFGQLAQRFRGLRAIAVFILLALFLFPTFRFVKLKLVQERAGRPSQAFVEKGRSIRSTDGEADQFYQWIKANTDRRSAFIDRELEIPTLAERALFIGIGSREPGQRKGFGPVDMILRLQSGYPARLLDTRTTIVDKVYTGRQPLKPAELEEVRSLRDGLYVVARTTGEPTALDTTMFRKVFASSQGNLNLYELNPR
ncbi:MAG: hypothetical protein V1694_00585 [Candidatus Eisenbacteria bacterium]